MKRIAIFSIAAVALMSVAFVSGAAAHTFRADTAVSIKFEKAKGNDPTATSSFEGNVTSEKARCQKKRTVRVLQRTEGGATEVGSDLTDADGFWQVPLSGDVAPGAYYAKVTKRVIRKDTKHRHVCKRAVSKDVTVK